MKGMIFDFNGTMIFDKEFHDKAWRAFLEDRIQREISEEEFQAHVYGRSAHDILSYFLEREVSGQESIQIEEEKEKIYRNLCLQSPDFHLAEGLPEFLDNLKEQGIPVTIATASARKNMKFFFENLNLSRWFDLNQVVYNDGTFPGKPAPDIFLKAAELLNLPISECTVFEDAKSGIQAAKSAGAGKIVGVASMLDEETLFAFGADTVIYDYLGEYSVRLCPEQEYQDFLSRMKGLQLQSINCACEMLMLDFEGYAFHALELTRVILNNDILFTSHDYQSWDGENDKNNDEWYFLDKYREALLGGTVTDIAFSPLHDLKIYFDNHLIIECYIANGCHHYDDENEQYTFFERKKTGFRKFLAVYNKRITISESRRNQYERKS